MKNIIIIVFCSILGIAGAITLAAVIKSKIDWEVMTLMDVDEQKELGCPYVYRRKS